MPDLKEYFRSLGAGKIEPPPVAQPLGFEDIDVGPDRAAISSEAGDDEGHGCHCRVTGGRQDLREAHQEHGTSRHPGDVGRGGGEDEAADPREGGVGGEGADEASEALLREVICG